MAKCRFAKQGYGSLHLNKGTIQYK